MRLCSLVRVCAVTMCLIAASSLTVSAMTFKPTAGRMGDICVLHHDGTYYLGYTTNIKGEQTAFGIATSSDGVHWKDRGIVRKGTGSGSLWKSPNFKKDGKFQYHSQLFDYPGPGQRIGFFESSDLFHWEATNSLFDIDPRWYKTDGRWDGIAATPRPAGGYYGYWTATPKDGSFGFAFGESTDGIHWKVLEPPKVDWGVYEGYKPEYFEVGGLDVIDGKYRAMINFSRRPGSRMLSLVADRPEGPFVLTKKNPTLFDGDAHFARFFPSPDGMLVVHFTLTKEDERDGQPQDPNYMALMKRAVVDKEGTLRLAYWQENEKLKGETVAVKTPAWRKHRQFWSRDSTSSAVSSWRERCAFPLRNPRNCLAFTSSRERNARRLFAFCLTARARSERSSPMDPTFSPGRQTWCMGDWRK